MLHIGKSVEKLLTEKKMRKKELIDLLGITRQGFENKLKTGHFKPNELEIVARYFDLEVYELLDMPVELEKVELIEEPRLSKLMERLLDEFKILQDQLSMKDQQINKLLDILGKLDPISEQARVLNLTGQFKEVA